MAQPHSARVRHTQRVHRGSDDLIIATPIELAPFDPPGADDLTYIQNVRGYLRNTLEQTRVSATAPGTTLFVSVRAVDPSPAAPENARFFLRVAPIVVSVYDRRPTAIPLTEEFGLVTGVRLFSVRDSATARDARRSTSLVIEVYARSHAEMAQKVADLARKALALDHDPLIVEF